MTRTRTRERILLALLRYLREYDDIPAREVSKRMAAHTAALLARRPSPDERCLLPLRELLALPVAVAKSK